MVRPCVLDCMALSLWGPVGAPIHTVNTHSSYCEHPLIPSSMLLLLLFSDGYSMACSSSRGDVLVASQELRCNEPSR